ncbi:Ketocytochalasin monooxygenase, partial [Clarias magur]
MGQSNTAPTPQLSMRILTSQKVQYCSSAIFQKNPSPAVTPYLSWHKLLSLNSWGS